MSPEQPAFSWQGDIGHKRPHEAPFKHLASYVPQGQAVEIKGFSGLIISQFVNSLKHEQSIFVSTVRKLTARSLYSLVGGKS